MYHLHACAQLLIFKNGGFVSLSGVFFVPFRSVCSYKSPSFSVQYHLHTFPQLLIFKNGHLLSRYRGGPSPESLAAWFSLQTGARCVPPGLDPFSFTRQNLHLFVSVQLQRPPLVVVLGCFVVRTHPTRRHFFCLGCFVCDNFGFLCLPVCDHITFTRYVSRMKNQGEHCCVLTTPLGT